MEGKRLGRYTIVRELGSGGMGTVYEALDADETRVALKLVHPHLLAREGFRERLIREAAVGRKIVHPNVVGTLDAGEIDGRPFIALEFVVGQTLDDLRQELGDVPESLCRHVGQMAALGLAAIHAEGIVHRDIKPENILITPDHDVRLMDLGLARTAAGLDRMTRTGQFVGSPVYAPPEQFTGDGVLDARSDLYSLGVTLFELATGAHPFKAGSLEALAIKIIKTPPPRPGQLRPQLSPFFDGMLLALLEKDPARRPSSAAELADILESGEDSGKWSDGATRVAERGVPALRRVRVPRDTECVGREHDLSALRSAFDAAKAGEGRVVLLEGEAGIGKSRLIDEMTRGLERDAEDVNFLYGSYPPGGAAVAVGAFASAYREQFGPAGCAPFVEETPILAPAFDALLRGDACPEGAQALSSDTLKTVFVHATRSLARQRPTVIVIDNLHFAPAEGRALFASLAMSVPGHRALLIGTMRPGLPAEWRAEMERLDHVACRELRRLGLEHVRRILAPVLGSSRFAEQLAISISAKADGNPLFLFEIVRSLRESGVVTQLPEGGWTTASRVEDFGLPNSVKSLLDARLERLTAEERELLECAACWGGDFDGRLVADALGIKRLPALRTLGRLEREHGIVRSVGGRFAFDHHALQEHIHARLPEPVREELHAALAEALEESSGAADAALEDLEGALCVELCEHFLRGARGRRALRYLAAAQTHLVANYSNERALSLSERVLAERGLLVGAERVQELLRTSLPLELLARRERHEEVVREAERIAVELGDQRLISRATNALGNCLFGVSRFVEAVEVHRRSLSIATENEDRRGIAAATGNLGSALYYLGRPAEAREHYERSLATSRAVGLLRGEVIGGNLGMLDCAEGRLAEARARFEAHLAASLEMGDRPGEPICLANLAQLDREEGDLENCERRLQQALAVSEQIGFRRMTAAAHLALGSLRSAESGGARGRDSLQAALECAQELRLHAVGVLARCELALIAPETVAEAQRALEEGEASLDATERRAARHLLWKATGDRAHLDAAKQLLDAALEQTPPEFHESMCSNLRVNREIIAASSAQPGVTDTDECDRIVAG